MLYRPKNLNRTKEISSSMLILNAKNVLTNDAHKNSNNNFLSPQPQSQKQIDQITDSFKNQFATEKSIQQENSVKQITKQDLQKFEKDDESVVAVSISEESVFKNEQMNHIDENLLQYLDDPDFKEVDFWNEKQEWNAYQKYLAFNDLIKSKKEQKLLQEKKQKYLDILNQQCSENTQKKKVLQDQFQKEFMAQIQAYELEEKNKQLVKRQKQEMALKIFKDDMRNHKVRQRNEKKQQIMAALNLRKQYVERHIEELEFRQNQEQERRRIRRLHLEENQQNAKIRSDIQKMYAEQDQKVQDEYLTTLQQRKQELQLKQTQKLQEKQVFMNKFQENQAKIIESDFQNKINPLDEAAIKYKLRKEKLYLNNLEQKQLSLKEQYVQTQIIQKQQIELIEKQRRENKYLNWEQVDLYKASNDLKDQEISIAKQKKQQQIRDFQQGLQEQIMASQLQKRNFNSKGVSSQMSPNEILINRKEIEKINQVKQHKGTLN